MDTFPEQQNERPKVKLELTVGPQWFLVYACVLASLWLLYLIAKLP